VAVKRRDCARYGGRMKQGVARNGKDHRVRRPVRGRSNGEETMAPVGGLGCFMLAEPAECVRVPGCAVV
jgi:hypothetical protein